MNKNLNYKFLGNMKDCLIVISGGMDSTTMLHQFKDRIALALTFDYGSKHSDKEIKCAAFHCEKFGIKHKIIGLDFFQKYLKSSYRKSVV